MIKKKKNMSDVIEYTPPEESTKEKNKKKSDQQKIRTPMEMTRELKKIGESYSRYSMLIWYISILAISIVMGILFELSWKMIVVCGVFYILMTPKLLYNYKKQKYEKKRFEDLCSYLTQMNQSFTSTHNILASLKETEATFTKGKMKDAMTVAIEKIENSYVDIRKAEEEALEYIASEYDCEKIRNLHDYLIRAEARGGDCTDEFKIIDRINEIWRNVVLNYYKTMQKSRNLVALYYGLLLAICIYLLKFFPEMIDLIGNGIVKVTNMIEIILFVIVYAFADSKLNVSLLRDAKFMSEESANAANAYINNFDNKKERKKYIPFIVFGFIVSTALFVLNPTGIVGIVSVGFIVLVFNMHKLTYYLNWLVVKGEMTRAFPKWLFDVMLLMQTDSVEVAIFNSREYAPPILRPELERICSELDEQPGNADSYMSFLAEFRITGVEKAMRDLYSLSVGTGNREVMLTVIDHSMTMLADSEKSSIKNKGDITTAYQFIPLLLMTVGMIAYLVALVLEVFGKVNSVMSGL